MNIVYIKIKGKDEMVFPDCCYAQCDNFIVVSTLGSFLEVGAFNLDIVEYIYLHHEEGKANSIWIDKIRSGKPTE